MLANPFELVSTILVAIAIAICICGLLGLWYRESVKLDNRMKIAAISLGLLSFIISIAGAGYK